MILDGNKKIEIKNSSITILAILLLAVYFISDFLRDKQPVIAGIYIVILVVSICLCAKKVSFHEAIYSLSVLLILGEILKNCVPHFKNPNWIFETLIKQFKFPTGSYFKMLLETPYIYFYLIGILLLLICIFAPKMSQSISLKNVFHTLGNYSLWAILTHMCAVCLKQHEIIENVIFLAFMVGAFWTAYTKDKIVTSSIVKIILLVIEISIFILLYPNQYTSFVESFQNAESITWIYSVGLFIICVLCILSENVIEDIIVGFAILGTNVMFLYGMLNKAMFITEVIVLFHVGALSVFYIVKNVFGFDDGYQKKRYLKGLLLVSYMVAFLFAIFITNRFSKSATLLCIAVLFAVVYFGNFIRIRGTILGTALYGAIPWILLETTMNSLGKMNSPLFAIILFTILFWIACSVALSWNDTANIKAITFERANSEKIINTLSGIAYFLTALVLFV